MFKNIIAGAFILSIVGMPAMAGAGINGQGSSFISNYIDQCKADLKNSDGMNISYQPTGSGAGRQGIINNTVDFAGTDIPFTAEEKTKLKNPIVHTPVIAGAVAITYNLPNVKELRLSRDTLAKIFNGEIKMWNDSIIKRDNPTVKLPNKVIIVVVRSDSSGTSNVFTNYLSLSKSWTAGITSSFPVPSGNGIAQKGSDGVSNFVASKTYSITYTETSFATERKLGIAKVINKAGMPLFPNPSRVTEAIRLATKNADGTLTLNFDPDSKTAYPISTVSYIVTYENPGDEVTKFLNYLTTQCQSKAIQLGYATLPK